MFTIDPLEKASIYKAWRTRVDKRLCDIFHDIRENNANTHRLTKDILQVLKAYSDSLEYKAK